MVLRTNSPCRACGRSAGGEFLSQRWERNQWPRPPSLAPSGQFTLRIAGGRLRMDTPCPYSPSLSPLAFGHLPLTRGVGPRSPITGVLSCLWRSPSGAQNQECVGALSSGPPGPECAKFTSGAVQFLRLDFPTNTPGANPASPQTFPLGGRWLAEGQTDEGAFPIKPSPLKGEGAPEGGG